MAHIGFQKLKDMLAAKGAVDPAALAAHIGRKKYGAAGFAALAAKGRAEKKVKQAVTRAASEAPVTAGASSHQERGAGRMDPAKIREALGLAADASDEEVKSTAATALGFVEEQPPLFEVAAAAPKTTAPKPGTMTIDVSAWQESQERLKRLEAQAAKQREAERDQVIAQAVQDGKFAPARRDHWKRLWDLDPEGTRDSIDGLQKNVIPVMASGYAGAPDEDIDAEFAHLFPPRSVSRG